MRNLLLPALALLPAAALAQTAGFTADGLAAAARSAVAEIAPDAAARSAVAARSERLRALLAVAQDRAGAQLAPDEWRALTAAFGPPQEDRDILASWLARGGQVAVADPQWSGIYNPLADGWLVLRWQQVGGAPRLAEAMLASGPLLRGGEAPVAGLEAMPFAQMLAARRRASLAAFPQLAREAGLFRANWPLLRVREGETVLAAARQQVGALAQWSRDNPAALRALDRLLSRGDHPALLPFPARLREALGPVGVVATGDGGAELVLQAPAYPARSLFAGFPPGAGPPQLFALDLAADEGTAP